MLYILKSTEKIKEEYNMVIVYLGLLVLSLVIIITLIQFFLLSKKRIAKELPTDAEKAYYNSDEKGRTFEDLYNFLEGESNARYFSEEDIYNMLLRQSDYMAERYDCADFRTQLLLKIYFDFEDILSDRCKQLIKNTFLSFKYYMDEGGDDSMCYWSENHQILFAVAEYLAGQLWPDEVFSNSLITGSEHMKKAKNRIEIWMKQRFDYGFSEYLSNNYLAEDIAPMANFIAYSLDKENVEKMKIIMDLLWLDVALNTVNNRFVAVSSRMYGNNKAGNYFGNSIISAIALLWGQEAEEKILSNIHLSGNEKKLIRESLEKAPNYIVICFTDAVKKGIYKLPEVIKNIALSNEEFTVKMGCGLSVSDLVNEDLIGQEVHQIMAQMGAESFTNPEVIENTVKYIKRNNMYTNSFLSSFKFLDLMILKPINLRRFAKKHSIVTHGIATGRGNVYTYRNAHYSMSTTIADNVGMIGTQGHIFTCNIGEALSFFLTHPAGNGENRYLSSPGYWVGNGRRPMSLQYQNVNITVYKMPENRMLGELETANLTHAYLPVDYYDEIEHRDNIVFARKNGIFLALIANGTLKYKPFSEDSLKGIYKNYFVKEEYRITREFDLIRKGGGYHCYITEMSDIDKESFPEFKKRILNNHFSFDCNGNVSYDTSFGCFCASYDGVYKVNGIDLEKEFLRYDCKFCKASRKADSITVSDGTNRLHLNFDNAVREIS